MRDLSCLKDATGHTRARIETWSEVTTLSLSPPGCTAFVGRVCGSKSKRRWERGLSPEQFVKVHMAED